MNFSACYQFIIRIHICFRNSNDKSNLMQPLKFIHYYRVSFADPLAVRHSLEIISEVATRDPYSVAMALGKFWTLRTFQLRQFVYLFEIYPFLLSIANSIYYFFIFFVVVCRHSLPLSLSFAGKLAESGGMLDILNWSLSYF